MTILALDLGKFNSVACIFSSESQKALRYQSLASSPQALHDLIVQVQPKRVVFETCSIAGWVHDLCETLSVPEIQIANPNGEAWKWKNVKRKTDKDDALKLGGCKNGCKNGTGLQTRDRSKYYRLRFFI